MHQYNFTSSNFDEHILDNLYLWNSISDIMQEIAKEEEEKQKRHLRRVVAKQERLKQRPPRLGKHKYDAICLFSFQAHSFSIILVQESWFFYFILPCRYEAAPVQVLLSEEITGSLRQLKVGWLYFIYFYSVPLWFFHLSDLCYCIYLFAWRVAAPWWKIDLKASRREDLWSHRARAKGWVLHLPCVWAD